eukprot:TRINITY_DN6698_c0_g1_i1.p1 TRINITY_DN6698_c0_g1~~TRINITY_DN6698_c0_g1_i1.p1  ORF type:complete len:812 (+),score=133.83 TRINITY_DN6698_c0_g1_i1:91-2526(+)
MSTPTKGGEAGDDDRPSQASLFRKQAVEIDLTCIGAALETVDSDDEGDSHLGASARRASGVLQNMGCSHSILDMSEQAKQARDKLRTQRPSDEVMCTVFEMLSLQSAPASWHRRIGALVDRMLNPSEPDKTPELTVFSSHLESLLGTVFAQIAEYVDSAPPEGEKGSEEECMVLSGLLIPSIMVDIVSASRLSLRSYHEHSQNLRQRGASRGRARRGRGNVSPKAGVAWRKRELSSLAVPALRTRQGSIASSFSAAFTEGSVQMSSAMTPKRRPDTRIDRGPQQSPADPSLPLPGSQLGPVRGRQERSPAQSHLTPSFASQTMFAPGTTCTTSPNGSMCKQHESPSTCHSISRPAWQRTSSRLSKPPGSPASATTGQDLERILERLSTLQYFDIIVETLCVVLCIKYEEQLTQLTTDGDTAGAKRAAEWVTARIIDEFYNDGIDPTQPLCQQLILCAEGLALEEGEICWRRAAGVDPDVAMVVWGFELPDDVGGMTLKRKDTSSVWFEWGTFAQPGIQCADGSHWSGPRLNPHTYAWRLGARELAEKLGLRRVDPDGDARLPSFLAERPGASLLDSASPTVYRDDGARSAAATSNRLRDMQQAGVPNLTLSAPPEGSSHVGGTKRKPHIRPADPASRRELERRYRQRPMGEAPGHPMLPDIPDAGEEWDEWDEEEEEEESESEAGTKPEPHEREMQTPPQRPEQDDMTREMTEPIQDPHRSMGSRSSTGVSAATVARIKRQRPGPMSGSLNRSSVGPQTPPQLHTEPGDAAGSYQPLRDKAPMQCEDDRPRSRGDKPRGRGGKKHSCCAVS